MEKELAPTTAFQAPQIIEKDQKRFALTGQKEKEVTYVQLVKEGQDWKRSDSTMDTSPFELAKSIKEGQTKVIMPSKAFLKEAKEQQFADAFKAPLLIEKGKQTYGLDKHEGRELAYFRLAKGADDKLKRTEEKYDTSPADLVRDIKSGEVKILLANKEYAQQKQLEKQDRQETQAKPSVEIKPIHIQPLTSRERKEVKAHFQEGQIQSDKHAKVLFEKFDKQLASIPDHVNGQKMDNQDKIKLLIGDYNDKNHNAYTVEKDKTVTFGSDRQVLTNENTQFSKQQLEKSDLKTQQQGLSF